MSKASKMVKTIWCGQNMWLRLMAIVVLSAAAGAWGQAVAKEKTPNADEIMREAKVYLAEAKDLSAKISTELTIREVEIRWHRAEEFSLVVERPNRLALICQSQTPNATVVSDGKKIVSYLPLLNQYVTKEAPDQFEGFFAEEFEPGMVLLSTFPMIRHFLSGYPLAEKQIGREYLGLTDIKGTKCHHLRLKQETADLDVWIQADDRPIIRKIKPDLSKAAEQISQQKYGKSVIEIEQSWHFDNWQVNSTLAPDRFGYSPKKFAQEVKAFGIKPKGYKPHRLIGERALDFKLPLLDGGKAKLTDHLGKDIVVLDFWATWCTPCRILMPIISEIAQQYAGKGVVFYAVNQGDTPEKIKPFLATMNLKLNVVLDSNSYLGSLYRVRGIPQTVIIDKDGIVKIVHTGLLSDAKEQLTQEIDSLLAGDKQIHQTYDLICKRANISPAKIQVRQKIKFSCTIANQGSNPIPAGSYNVQLQIDNKEIYTAVGDKAIPPGREVNISIGNENLRFDVIKAGSHQWRVIVDPYNQYAELDENNNVLTGVLEVKGRRNLP